MGRQKRPFPLGHFRLRYPKNYDKTKAYPVEIEYIFGGRPLGRNMNITVTVAEYVLDPKLDTTLKDKGKLEDVVILSTIHYAEGLEADIVYLINASAKSYPTPRAILNGENNIEEERRCLYVALTRAKDELRVYRDIHSIHISNPEEKYYFFNKLPQKLYDSKIIAANYFNHNP